eukprot:393839-Prorocentrum_minimum.AAC.2
MRGCVCLRSAEGTGHTRLDAQKGHLRRGVALSDGRVYTRVSAPGGPGGPGRVYTRRGCYTRRTPGGVKPGGPGDRPGDHPRPDLRHPHAQLRVHHLEGILPLLAAASAASKRPPPPAGATPAAPPGATPDAPAAPPGATPETPAGLRTRRTRREPSAWVPSTSARTASADRSILPSARANEVNRAPSDRPSAGGIRRRASSSGGAACAVSSKSASAAATTARHTEPCSGATASWTGGAGSSRPRSRQVAPGGAGEEEEVASGDWSSGSSQAEAARSKGGTTGRSSSTLGRRANRARRNERTKNTTTSDTNEATATLERVLINISFFCFFHLLPWPPARRPCSVPTWIPLSANRARRPAGPPAGAPAVDPPAVAPAPPSRAQSKASMPATRAEPRGTAPPGNPAPVARRTAHDPTLTLKEWARSSAAATAAAALPRLHPGGRDWPSSPPAELAARRDWPNGPNGPSSPAEARGGRAGGGGEPGRIVRLHLAHRHLYVRPEVPEGVVRLVRAATRRAGDLARRGRTARGGSDGPPAGRRRRRVWPARRPVASWRGALTVLPAQLKSQRGDPGVPGRGPGAVPGEVSPGRGGA